MSAEQLPLWLDADDLRRAQAVTWNRMRREFVAGMNLPRIPTDYDFTLEASVCLRCGYIGDAGVMDINHDLGYCGCPNEHDPAWKNYEKAPGFRSVWNNGTIRSLLTEEEMSNRWDVGKLPLCADCGHAFGLHSYGRSCSLYCGCGGYEPKV